MAGRFITVEGGEGVGKSSFSDGLAARLSDARVHLIRTFEPGGTPTAVKLREIFISPPPTDPLLIETEFCIVSAARAQHVGKKIAPALKKGDWVLCDRFADSSRVYQGMYAGIPEANVEAIIGFTTFGIEPDVTFILDCPVEVSMARLGKRGETSEGSRFDKGSKAFHESIRQHFLKLKKKFPKRIVVIDASGTSEEAIDEAMTYLQKKFL